MDIVAMPTSVRASDVSNQTFISIPVLSKCLRQVIGPTDGSAPGHKLMQ